MATKLFPSNPDEVRASGWTNIEYPNIEEEERNMTQAEKLSAAEIISLVMQDVQGLAKKDKNTQQGFNFRGIDAVMNAVGPALRKHGGFIAPSIDSVTYDTAPSKSGGVLNIARVVVTYAVHGQKGEPILASVAAEAFDSGDKATAKAMSVAYRTALLQLLCLPTDEADPDTFSYETAAAADWDEQIAALTTKAQARKLWAQANAEGASKATLAKIQGKADTLND